jgi:hypothetical protein
VFAQAGSFAPLAKGAIHESLYQPLPIPPFDERKGWGTRRFDCPT